MPKGTRLLSHLSSSRAQIKPSLLHLIGGSPRFSGHVADNSMDTHACHRIEKGFSLAASSRVEFGTLR